MALMELDHMVKFGLSGHTFKHVMALEHRVNLDKIAEVPKDHVKGLSCWRGHVQVERTMLSKYRYGFDVVDSKILLLY